MLSAPWLLLALAAPKTTVLVTDLKTEGIDGTTVLQLSSAIAQALSERPEYSVLTPKDVSDLLSLEEQKQLAGCAEEGACYAQIKRLENMDLLLSGSAGLVGKDLAITLVLIDAKTSIDKNRASAIVQDRTKLVESMRGLLAQLFGWSGAETKAAFHLAKGKKKFAVFDLVGSGVGQGLAVNLTQILSAELKRIEGASIVGREDIKAMLALEADKQMLGCADDTSCVAEIGAALGVDYIVAGHVGKISATWIVSLRLIAPSSLEVESRVTESFAGVEEQLVGAVRHAGRRLVGIEPPNKGALVLTTAEAEGAIYLDGRNVGAGKIPDLDVGRHNLHIVKDGYLEWRSDIYVDASEETVLAVELTPEPTEWYESWVFWGTALGVAALAAGSIVIVAAGSDGATGPGEQTHAFTFEVGLPER
jgi:hypothetical protein